MQNEKCLFVFTQKFIPQFYIFHLFCNVEFTHTRTHSYTLAHTRTCSAQPYSIFISDSVRLAVVIDPIWRLCVCVAFSIIFLLSLPFATPYYIHTPLSCFCCFNAHVCVHTHTPEHPPYVF